jgi:hypothetical protein
VPIKTNLTIDIPAREKFKQRIRLVSGGACHPTAFPNGEVTVYPWDVQVDDWVLTKGKFQNASMYDIIPIIADLNGASVEDLYVGDATTILLVARSLRHNNSIEFSPTCQHCKRVNKPETLKIPDQLRKAAEKPDGWSGFDTVTLPVSKDPVVIRPLRIKDEKAIEARSPEQVKSVQTLTAHILYGIVSVGGGVPDNLDELVRWFRSLNADDQDYLSNMVDQLHPRIDNEVDFMCDFCQEKFTHSIDLGKPFPRSNVV